jgi:hypothetical protein
MAASDPYDWVDDEDLDMEAVLQRFETLEPARVITTPPQTSAGSVVVITKSIFGRSEERPTFA